MLCSRSPLNLHESSRPPTSPSLKPLPSHLRRSIPVNRWGHWALNESCSWCFSSATPFENILLQNGFKMSASFRIWYQLGKDMEHRVNMENLKTKVVQNIYHIMYIRLCSPNLINTSSSRFLPFHCLSFFHKRSENFCAGSLVVDAKTCYDLLQTRNNLKENTVFQRQFSMF